MSNSGIQPPPIPSGQGIALKKILTSLGLPQAVREVVVEGADISGPSPRADNPATQSVVTNNATLQQSPLEDTSTVPQVESHDSARQGKGLDDEGSGIDLQLWDSSGDIESYHSVSGFNVLTPCVPDTSPLGQALGVGATVMSNDQSQVNYEGPSIFDEEDANGSGDSNESLIDELSHRVGTLTIGPTGRTKLRGPSLMFNAEKAKESRAWSSHSELRKNAPSISIHNVNGPDVPEELEERLVNQYFDRENPFSDVVDREIYTLAKAKHRKGEETPYFSQALCNAMCAIGAAFEARYHPTFVTFPKSLVRFFADRARVLLEAELDDPSLATDQALVVLSCHEVGNGNKSRAWLYSGMAARLAFDLALHLDISSNVFMGQVAAAEATLRYRLFWGVHAADQILGFELGRPVRHNMEDVTVKPPTLSDCTDNHDTSPRASDQNASASDGHFSLDQHVSQQRVALFNIMATCGYILYGTSNYPKTTLQELNVGIVMQLRDWKTSLPPGIQIDLDKPNPHPAPSVLLLHMHYHQSIIYAHRPWMSKHVLQPQPPRGPGHRHAREMCVQSAIAISKILVLYESWHDLRHIHHSAVHVTSSAALLLLFADVCSLPEWKGIGIRACLSTCFRALGEFSVSWESATQVANTLAEVQQNWRNRRVSVPTSNHPRSSMDAFDAPTSTDSGPYNTLPIDFGSWGQDGNGLQDGVLFDSDFDWSLLPG